MKVEVFNMGYYTYFELEACDEKTGTLSNAQQADIESYIRNVIFKDSYNEIAKYLLDGGDELKWYDWEEDMIVMAKYFPSIHFTLYGRGEDREDIWIADFLGNKRCVRHAVLKFPEEFPLEWR